MQNSLGGPRGQQQQWQGQIGTEGQGPVVRCGSSGGEQCGKWQVCKGHEGSGRQVQGASSSEWHGEQHMHEGSGRGVRVREDAGDTVAGACGHTRVQVTWWQEHAGDAAAGACRGCSSRGVQVHEGAGDAAAGRCRGWAAASGVANSRWAKAAAGVCRRHGSRQVQGVNSSEQRGEQQVGKGGSRGLANGRWAKAAAGVCGCVRVQAMWQQAGAGGRQWQVAW